MNALVQFTVSILSYNLILSSGSSSEHVEACVFWSRR